ncbi:substrate-binding domain-containing protein [Parapedobacter sp. GCM10030251]|uniref:LacI family DNA-binding transcriptional regulator n=1 Tax=Parapedobacter sp. GCM10030251 TaxID=3273419 RepID=UPI00361F557A
MKKEHSPRPLSGVKEIARRANVSIATVDRVIHNRKGVSEATRQKINGIIKEMGFQPNIMASRLASKKTNRFAVLIPNANETDYWDGPRRGVERAHQEIKQYGIQQEIFLFDLNDKTTFTKQAAAVIEGGFDGVVLAPSFVDEARAFTQKCEEKKIPYVFINSDVPNAASLAYVGPHLFKSGYLAGRLVQFGVKSGKILLVNISKEIDAYHHLLRKEEGFRAYIGEVNKPVRTLHIEKIDITNTTDKAVAAALEETLAAHPDIGAIFVTNSRVRSVANYLRKRNSNHFVLIGYDLVKENIGYLIDNTIDFLIGQKPEEQGYLGLMALFQAIVLGKKIEKEQYMPIDIITKENVEFYKN